METPRLRVDFRGGVIADVSADFKLASIDHEFPIYWSLILEVVFTHLD